VGPIEELLADRVAETALFDWRVCVLKVSQLEDQVGSYEVMLPDMPFPPHITDNAAHAELARA
jgi:hypothetical protein